MTKKSFLALCVVTVVAVVLAVVAVVSQPRLRSSADAGQPLFPNLVRDVDHLKSVVLRHGAEIVSLDWDGKGWHYRERANYPADNEKVNALIVHMARMIKIEGKTKQADRYDRLDLDDPTSPDSKAKQVTLIDTNGKEMANVVVGKRHYTLGSREGGTYVRIPGDPQTWLVEGDLIIGERPGEWLKRELLDIKENAIKHVAVTLANGEKILVGKKDPGERSLAIENLPKGQQPSSEYAADNYGRVLANLNFDDVLPAAGKPFPKEKTVTAAIDGWSGFQVNMSIYEEGEKTFIKIAGAPPPSDPKAEKVLDLRVDWTKTMADLNAKADGWVFEVPSYEVAALTHSMSDLLKKPDPNAGKNARSVPAAE